jgi:HEAT repeat protein
MTARGWCRQVAGAIVVAALLEGNPARAAEQAAVATPAAVHEAIAALGRLDYDTRLRAARTLRRTPPEVAVPALRDAVAHHADGYVRYRALVLLVGFRDAATRDLMRQALRDGNDRLRAVAYAYFEHEPDPLVVPQLVAALETERSEFVRPALTRAVAAAAAADETARAAILPLVERGEDVFRAAVIEALGDHRVAAAVPALEAIARREGPLQDDAVRALGVIGDARALRTLREVQAGAAREVQPGLAAAFCLLDAACERHEAYLRETLAFAVRTAGYQELLRATATALRTRRARRSRSRAARWRSATRPSSWRSSSTEPTWRRRCRCCATPSTCWKRTSRRSDSSPRCAVPTGRRPKGRRGAACARP